jgi:hypothetical protein
VAFERCPAAIRGHPIDAPIFVVTREAPEQAAEPPRPGSIALGQTRIVESEGVTHLRDRVVRA